MRDKRSPSNGIPHDPKDEEICPSKVMDTIPGLIWSAFPDGGVEHCNRGCLGYMGLSFHEIKGWGWVAAIYPQDTLGLLDDWRAAVLEPATLVAGVRMRRSDGSYRWHLVQAQPLCATGSLRSANKRSIQENSRRVPVPDRSNVS